jgi:hypothetical protein
MYTSSIRRKVANRPSNLQSANCYRDHNTDFDRDTKSIVVLRKPLRASSPGVTITNCRRTNSTLSLTLSLSLASTWPNRSRESKRKSKKQRWSARWRGGGDQDRTVDLVADGLKRRQTGSDGRLDQADSWYSGEGRASSPEQRRRLILRRWFVSGCLTAQLDMKSLFLPLLHSVSDWLTLQIMHFLSQLLFQKELVGFYS